MAWTFAAAFFRTSDKLAHGFPANRSARLPGGGTAPPARVSADIDSQFAAGTLIEICRAGAEQKTVMSVGLRIFGGAVIVAVFFFGTLFLLEYSDYGGDKWQRRFLGGSPVVVRFSCGATNFDCNDWYTLSYQGSAPSRCEHILKNGEGPELTGWCNGRPEEHSFCVTGALFTYDRLGRVMRDDKLVGQLSDR